MRSNVDDQHKIQMTTGMGAQLLKRCPLNRWLERVKEQLSVGLSYNHVVRRFKICLIDIVVRRRVETFAGDIRMDY